MKELYNDNMHMTNAELYKSAVDRAYKMGAVDNADVVIILEDEIRKYREKIVRLEEANKKLERTVEGWQKYWDEQPKAEMKAVNIADFETIITVRSRQKVQDVDIYFQMEDES